PPRVPYPTLFRSHVGEGGDHAAPGAEPAVLEIGGGHPPAVEVHGPRLGGVPSPRVEPEPAVDERRPPPAGAGAEVEDLIGMRAVAAGLDGAGGSVDEVSQGRPVAVGAASEDRVDGDVGQHRPPPPPVT